MIVKIPTKLFFLAFICLIITSSCKKEIDYHPEWDVSSMSGKVDGVLLQCSFTTAQTYTVNGKTSLQILGNKENDGFSFLIDDFKGNGIYSLASNNIATYLSGVSGLQDAYLGASGTIKIVSSTDKMIKGTFDFKGQNISNGVTKSITEGQFSINYK